jgi:hypothetical protein
VTSYVPRRKHENRRDAKTEVTSPCAHRRLVGLAVLTGIVAALVAYTVVNVPLVAPRLSRTELVRYWGAAVLAALIVGAVVLVVVTATLRHRRAYMRRSGLSAGAPAAPRAAPATRFRIPCPLRWQRIPGRTVAVAALTSSALATVVGMSGHSGAVVGLALLLPWVPLFTVEAVWKYEHYGVFAMFAMLVLLQIVHMGEHTVQVTQLVLTEGDLARSHGVFAQLDFELVHFVTDSGVWLSLGALVYLLRGGNHWLWVAFAAASLHQIEHFYLFWLNTAHESIYTQGGFAGIMGEGGLIGSPLDRPYLHFAYNFVVVVPMAVALWDEAVRVDEGGGAA